MSRLTNLRMWIVVLLLAAAAGWFLLPQAPAERALVMPRRDAWAVPRLPRRAVDNATVALAATAPFWGVAGPPAAAAGAVAAVPEDTSWRIAAVFGSTSRRGVLISFAAQGKPPQRLFAGDKLPSGHLITRVDEREVCVRIGSKNYRLGVERREF